MTHDNYGVTRDGNLAYTGSQKCQTDAQVVVGGVEASTQIASATVAIDPHDAEGVVADNWDVEQDARHTNGVLTNCTRGVNLNSMQTMRPLGDPCQAGGPAMAMMVSLAAGAKLSGTVSDSAIDLELLDQSIDRERRFRAALDVKRAR
jgi:Tfp pilus tip-associated adhesin PilY1